MSAALSSWVPHETFEKAYCEQSSEAGIVAVEGQGIGSRVWVTAKLLSEYHPSRFALHRTIERKECLSTEDDLLNDQSCQKLTSNSPIVLLRNCT